jgi:hypothetical protein
MRNVRQIVRNVTLPLYVKTPFLHVMTRHYPGGIVEEITFEIKGYSINEQIEQIGVEGGCGFMTEPRVTGPTRLTIEAIVVKHETRRRKR